MVDRSIGTTYPVEHSSDIAHIQIGVRKLARELGFLAVEQTLIATAVSELASNIYRYARNGSILMERISDEHHRGIRITARDTGPGISDLDRAVNREYSTGGSLGLGLPSVKRIMDSFKIESAPGTGTVVVIEKWKAS